MKNFRHIKSDPDLLFRGEEHTSEVLTCFMWLHAYYWLIWSQGLFTPCSIISTVCHCPYFTVQHSNIQCHFPHCTQQHGKPTCGSENICQNNKNIYQNNKWKIFLTFRYHYFLDSLRGVHITVSGAIKARQSNSLTLLYKNDLCSATMVWFLSSGIKYSGWQQFVKLENMKQPGENHNH